AFARRETCASRATRDGLRLAVRRWPRQGDEVRLASTSRHPRASLANLRGNGWLLDVGSVLRGKQGPVLLRGQVRIRSPYPSPPRHTRLHEARQSLHRAEGVAGRRPWRTRLPPAGFRLLGNRETRRMRT